MDKKRVQAEAALLPEAIGLPDQGPTGLLARISTKEGLSQAFDWVVTELQRIAEASTPPPQNQTGGSRPIGGPTRSNRLLERLGELRGPTNRPLETTFGRGSTQAYRDEQRLYG